MMSGQNSCNCEKYERALIQIEEILRYRSCVCGLDVHGIVHKTLPREKLGITLEEYFRQKKANGENEK